jgi:hypothetical protein
LHERREPLYVSARVERDERTEERIRRYRRDQWPADSRTTVLACVRVRDSWVNRVRGSLR